MEIREATTRLQLLAKFDKIGMYWKDMVTPQTQGQEEELGPRKDKTMSGPMSLSAVVGQIDLNVFSLCAACLSFWLTWPAGDMCLTSSWGRQETLINRPASHVQWKGGRESPRKTWPLPLEGRAMTARCKSQTSVVQIRVEGSEPVAS